MEAALEVTARYCGPEMERYVQCVVDNPQSWNKDCHHLKMSVAQCASSHPIIRQIRQDCAEPFQDFDLCLRKNEANMHNCTEHMRRFLQCVEQVQLDRPCSGSASPAPAAGQGTAARPGARRTGDLEP
uniref:Coiled-coil-helix-coiled-coil-helix domain containing 5 n=1 Tax=Monodelphis domestica TaxID=13616 RepID=F6WVX5_MONDO